MRTRFVAVVVVSLSACATQATFPLSISNKSDAARVRFINKLNNGYVSLYPQHDCNEGVPILSNRIFDIAVGQLEGNTITRAEIPARPTLPARQFAEYNFEPSQIINVAATCIGGLSFIARPNTNYEVSISETGKPVGCDISVDRLEVHDNAILRIPHRDVHSLICKNALQ